MTAHTAVTPAVSDDDASWTDLAQNGPGQAVRAQAIAEQREQPVVTWIARVLGVHTTERAWRMGEKGEELVPRRNWHGSRKAGMSCTRSGSATAARISIISL